MEIQPYTINSQTVRIGSAHRASRIDENSYTLRIHTSSYNGERTLADNVAPTMFTL